RRIIRSALEERREPLAQAGLRNFAVLERPLARMHTANPGAIPVASILDRAGRDELARDLLVRALSESPEAQSEDALIRRVNEQEAAGRVPAAAVRRALDDLAATGHAVKSAVGWSRTARPYTESEVDARSLAALVGVQVQGALAAAGFTGLADLTARS